MNNMTKFQKFIWYGVAAILIFAPLAKGAVKPWSQAVVEGIVFFLLFLWMWKINNAKHKERLRKTLLDWPIWLFVVLAGVSCFFSIYKYASVVELLRLIAVVGVFYLIVNNFTRKMISGLSSLIVFLGVGMSLLGFGQYFLDSITHGGNLVLF